MDQKNSLEGLEATFNVENKHALMAVPFNRYKTLREQIADHLKKEFDIHVNKLKALEFVKDPEHALEKVVLAEGGANQVKEKKRGRKTKNARTRPISCSFDLPIFCYDSSIAIERILATPPKNYNPKKGGDITPFERRKFTVTERARNWIMEMSKRDDNRMCDVHSTHIPSNKRFRSKLELIRFILHESLPNNTRKERKSAESATEHDGAEMITCSKKSKTCPT